MIEPGALNNSIRNTLNQTSNRERTNVSADKKETTESDSVETNATRGGERPASEPVSSREEADNLASLLGEQIVGSPGAAFSAQTGLDPDTVLSLIG